MNLFIITLLLVSLSAVAQDVPKPTQTQRWISCMNKHKKADAPVITLDTKLATLDDALVVGCWLSTLPQCGLNVPRGRVEVDPHTGVPTCKTREYLDF
jgi:hypothetical protein